MRILEICSARSIGGGERHVADLSNELTKRGHDVFLALAQGAPVASLLDAGPAGRIRHFPLRGALDVASAIRIGRFVRESGIEMIAAHLARDYPIAAVASRVAGVPFIITRHLLHPMNRLHRGFLRDVSYAIAPSAAGADHLSREGIFPADKIVTIPHGLDPEKFPLRVPPARDAAMVGTIANLHPLKGIDVLIEAAAIVVRAMPNVKFEVVGEDRSNDGRNENQLRSMIADLGLDDAVKLSGWSNSPQTALATFDILVSPSRSESFGFVVAEAMLTGVPVVASETAGAREIISHSSLGRLVPVDSSGALADAIIELLANSSERDKLALSGRSHIIENFSLAKMIDMTEELYRRTLGVP